MALHRAALPQTGRDLFLTYVGTETDLIFNRGVELPGFATYPLLASEQGRTRLRRYLSDMIALARTVGAGVILESHTWVANRDRALTSPRSGDRLARRSTAVQQCIKPARRRLCRGRATAATTEQT